MIFKLAGPKNMDFSDFEAVRQGINKCRISVQAPKSQQCHHHKLQKKMKMFANYHFCSTCTRFDVQPHRLKRYQIPDYVLLKEEGHYFPQSSHRVPDANKFQLELFQKLWKIIICCNMLSSSIFYVFLNCKTIGPKKLNWAEEDRNFKRFFLEICTFSLFWCLETDFGPS